MANNDINTCEDEYLSLEQVQNLVFEICSSAKQSTQSLQNASDKKIDVVLDDISKDIISNAAAILEANSLDIKKAEDKGLSNAMIDRLKLDEARLKSIANAVIGIKSLPSPVGDTLWESIRPNGLKIQRVRVPIGVLGMIYESRPNVTVDAAALCLKSRNAVILRGGSESLESSKMLHRIIETILDKHELPKACVSLIPTPDRNAVTAMLNNSKHIDVMIPRGGKGLIERVMAEAKMPVFSHLDGICHIYIHKDVEPEIAVNVPLNAKLRRTGICGAMETLLLDQNLNPELAHAVLDKFLTNGCEIVGDKLVQQLDSRVKPATSDDWATEYLAPKLSVAVVQGLDEAITHINTYGSHHTDSILTENPEVAEKFLNNVDSGIVMHNTSTQFADGGEFGMGAEIGIATGKMHARGPVGVEQLCTYKYKVLGSGQTRP